MNLIHKEEHSISPPGISEVGVMGVLVSSWADTHTPRQWAEITARGIIEPDQGIDTDRLKHVLDLRERFVEILQPFFISPNPELTETVVSQLSASFVLSSTSWAYYFNIPEVRYEVVKYIKRNLSTAQLQSKGT